MITRRFDVDRILLNRTFEIALILACRTTAAGFVQAMEGAMLWFSPRVAIDGRRSAWPFDSDLLASCLVRRFGMKKLLGYMKILVILVKIHTLLLVQRIALARKRKGHRPLESI
jgi:hypothetical protein